LDDRLREIEAALGVELPADYRDFATTAGKVERDFGGSYLSMWGLDDIVELNRGYEMGEVFPGLVLIGSDGGGEAVGFDFRSSPPSVVLVNFVSSGWHEAVLQAETFTEFLAQREAGLAYKFDE
jgi:hypothetical protein